MRSYLLLLEHLPVIIEETRGHFGLGALAMNLQGAGEHILVRITHGNHLHRSDLHEAPEVALAIPPGTDQTDATRFACGRLRSVDSAERGSGQGCGGSLEETAAIDGKIHAVRRSPSAVCRF